MSIGIGMGYVAAGAGSMAAPILVNSSVFLCRNNAGVHTNDVEYYNSLSGVSNTETTTIDRHYFVMPIAATIKNFRVKYDATLTGTMSVEFYIVINGAATLIATADINGSTIYNDGINTALSVGDLVCYKVIFRNSPTASHYWTHLEMQHATQMALCGNNKASLAVDTAVYQMIGNSGNQQYSASSDGECYWPCDGKIGILQVRLSAAPGIGKTRIIKVYREGFATDGTLTISGTNTTGTLTLNKAKVQGNLTMIECTGTGTADPCYISYSLSFTPTARGEFPIFFLEYDSLNLTQRSWNYISSIKAQWAIVGTPFATGTEQRRVPLRSGYAIKKLYCRASTAPGSGKSLELSYMKDDSTSIGLLATISGTATTAKDNTNYYNTVEGEEYALSVMPVNTPTNPSRIYASCVIFK